jgi:diguanylate cyclase (GGDEF)-like protein/PAS domain S-box-containing protein
MAAALAAGMVVIVEQTRQVALHVTKRNLEHTAITIENIINRHLLQVDTTLARIPMLLPRASMTRAPAQEAAAASHQLQNVNIQNFAFRDLLIVKPDGGIWASGRSGNDKLPFRMADVEQSLRGSGTVILGPYRHPMTGSWIWYLARNVELPQLGKVHVLAELPLESVRTALGNIVDIDGLQIFLRRANGGLLASFPHEERLIGHRPDHASPALEESPVHELRSDDGQIAGFGIVKSTLYPDLYVELARSHDSSMAEWIANRDRVVMICAFGIVLISAFGLLLLLLLRREERIEAEREQVQQTLADAIEVMPDGFAIWDRDDRMVACNSRFRTLYEKSAAEIRPGVSFEELVRFGARNGQFPQAGDDIEGFVAATVDWHRSTEGSIERALPNDVWLRITESRISNGGIVGIRTDITALKHATDRINSVVEELSAQNVSLRERDRAIGLQNMRFDATLNNLSQGLIMVDHLEQVTVFNRRFLEIFGLALQLDLYGMPLAGMMEAIVARGHFSAEEGEDIYRWHARHGEKSAAGTITMTTHDHRTLNVIQRPMDDGGFVATYEDITDRVQAEKQVRFLALHDPLTHLPNRAMLHRELEGQLTGRSRKAFRGLALLYLDLDKFKYVNDTLGHSAGDALLQGVAARIKACLRKSDLVARLGGDEFAVMVVGSNIARKAEGMAERIIASVAEPFVVNGHAVTVGVSIGIAVTESHDCDPDTLRKNADLALYHSKEAGRGGCSLFQPEMEARLVNRLRTEADLRDAVLHEHLELAYQPLIDLTSDEVLGFEALARWNHPERGMVSPAEFIPLAEETGIIVDLGAWCLRRACFDIAAIPGAAKVAVNLSAIQLKTDTIVETVLDALADSGLAPGRLELEITETALLDDDERIIRNLHALRDAGIGIVLDDFGTGYSSLNYLRRFPFNKIKIDKVFVDEATTRADCASIITSIVELATRLHMSTTAEGIETIAQLELVRTLGCTEGQGYLLGKPGNILSALALIGRPDIVPASRKVERLVRRH